MKHINRTAGVVVEAVGLVWVIYSWVINKTVGVVVLERYSIVN